MIRSFEVEESRVIRRPVSGATGFGFARGTNHYGGSNLNSEEDTAQSVGQSDVYLKTKQLGERYDGASHMYIERGLKNDPAFPRSVFLGRHLKLSEKWEAARTVAHKLTAEAHK